MAALAQLDLVLAKALRQRDLPAIVLRVLTYLALIVGGGLFMLPALWMLTTAFKTYAEAQQFPPVWLPTTIQLSVPAIAAIGGAVLLAEPITARLLLASVAILGGIALTIHKKK
jgi:ABC-type glycerol-3-phosphate transport system permease component